MEKLTLLSPTSLSQLVSTLALLLHHIGRVSTLLSSSLPLLLSTFRVFSNLQLVCSGPDQFLSAHWLNVARTRRQRQNEDPVLDW